jgi:hypothetical protein
MEQGTSLEYIFRLYHSDTEMYPESILILPSDFIMYDGKPLVTDTIRISLE